MSMTGGATPAFRDALSINSEGGGGFLDDNVQMQRAKENLLKQQLKRSLKLLPAPKNEYEINFAGAVPEGGEEEKEEVMEEDAQDREMRLRKEAQAQQDAENARRSVAIQRDLPRPLTVNTAYNSKKECAAKSSRLAAASAMVHEEMMAMLLSDAVQHPVKGGTVPPNARQAPPVDDACMAEARRLVASELEAVNAAAKCPTPAEYADMLAKVDASLVYVPELRAHKAEKDLSAAERLSSLKHEMEIAQAHLARERKKVGKVETKLGKLTMGYQKRSESLLGKARQMIEESEATVIEQSTYALMCEYEVGDLYPRVHLQQTPYPQTSPDPALLFPKLSQSRSPIPETLLIPKPFLQAHSLPKRMQRLEAELGHEVKREVELQNKYKDLMLRKQQLLAA